MSVSSRIAERYAKELASGPGLDPKLRKVIQAIQERLLTTTTTTTT